jgi:hypothetical protein
MRMRLVELKPTRGAASAAKGLSSADGSAYQTRAHADRRPLCERGGRAAGHPTLDRPRACTPWRPSGAARRPPLDLPSGSPRCGGHTARRSGRLEASERRLKSLERYSTALLRTRGREAGTDPQTQESPPRRGFLEARATGLEPATSGVTGRRSKPTELRPRAGPRIAAVGASRDCAGARGSALRAARRGTQRRVGSRRSS